MCINKNKELLPYYEKARKLLSYDSETGKIIWKVKVAKKIKVGSKAGFYDRYGYIRIKLEGKTLSSHRIAWFFTYGNLPDVIDHINRIKDDNRIINLRSCTHAENQKNKGVQSNNTSGYKGVCWHKRHNKWISQIKINGKSKNLGYFDCPKEASMVYEAKAKELFGEFYINNN